MPNPETSRIELARYTPPQPDRGATKAASRAERKEAQPAADKYENVPELTKERLKFARVAIDAALEKLKKPDKKMEGVFKKYGIALNTREYYLAIGIKESKLNPTAVSGSNAKGLFQILFDDANESNVLDDVKRIYGVDLSHDDVFYDGNDATKQAAAAANNAYVYILYWHLCGDYYRQKQGLDIKKIDRDRATAFAYNMGPSAFSTLWKELKPKSFGEFILKIGQKLEKEFPEKIDMPKGKTGLIPDPGYAVEYWPGFYLKEKFAPEDSIKVGKRKFTGRKIMESKKYSEVIYSLWYRPTLSPAELAKLNAKAPKTKEIEHIQGKDYETIEPPKRWMWGVATTLYSRLKDEYKIPYFTDPEKDITTKVKTIITMLIEYNQNVLKAEVFEDIDPEAQDPNVPAGTKVFFPNKKYIERYLEKINAPVSKEPEPEKEPENLRPTIEVLPKSLPLYSGPNAAALTKKGREILKYAAKKPPVFEIPELYGKKLDVNLPSKNGVMKKEDVKFIIIHATEGTKSGMTIGNKEHAGLYVTQNIHYLLRLDGTIELIRNEWINPDEKDPKKKKDQKRVALNHAGRWAAKKTIVKYQKNKKGRQSNVVKGSGSMALWNGDEDVTLGTIGIEVETPLGGTYNEAQYKALKPLLEWIGSRYNIPKSNVLAHSQMAVVDLSQWVEPKHKKIERWQRGRKQDPRKVDWSKLGLPDNYRLVDPDVAAGTIGSHIKKIREAMAGSEKKGWGLNTDETMLTGLDAADKIWAAKVKAAKEKAAKEAAAKRKTPRTN